MKSKYAYAIVKKTNPHIRILDVYETDDVAIEDDEKWQPVEIKPIAKMPKNVYAFHKRN